MINNLNSLNRRRRHGGLNHFWLMLPITEDFSQKLLSQEFETMKWSLVGCLGLKTSHQWNVGSSHKSGVSSALGQPCQCRGTRCQCWIPVACSWNPEWWVGQIFWHLFHALFLAAGPEQSFCNASTRMIQLTKLKVGQTNLQKCFCDTKTCRVEPILTLVSWALIIHLLSTM